MRRLIAAAIVAATLPASGCRREKIRLEPTDETPVVLSSTLRMGDPASAVQLVKGFHDIEHNAWRWTTRHFAVALRPPEGSAERGAKLVVHFSAPEPVIQRAGPVTLTAVLGSQPLGSITCDLPGQRTLSVDVPAAALRSEAVTIDFTLDKALPPGTLDGRELGVIVSSIGLESP